MHRATIWSSHYKNALEPYLKYLDEMWAKSDSSFPLGHLSLRKKIEICQRRAEYYTELQRFFLLLKLINNHTSEKVSSKNIAIEVVTTQIYSVFRKGGQPEVADFTASVCCVDHGWQTYQMFDFHYSDILEYIQTNPLIINSKFKDDFEAWLRKKIE